eukprot:1161172-Pelagomonas_calceolata.AAC.1
MDMPALGLVPEWSHVNEVEQALVCEVDGEVPGPARQGRFNCRKQAPPASTDACLRGASAGLLWGERGRESRMRDTAT